MLLKLSTKSLPLCSSLYILSGEENGIFLFKKYIYILVG